MKIKNTEIEILKGDITALDVAAIVNPANIEMQHGGGLAKVIAQKGGPLLVEESQKQAPIEMGGAIVTTGGELKARNVIHLAGQSVSGLPNQETLRAGVHSALKLADDMHLETIAFPAVGCGLGKFPPVGAAKILTQEIFKIAQHTPTLLRKIIICLHDDKMFEIFRSTIGGYLKHIQEDLGPGPYVTTDIIIEVDGGVVLIERSNPPYGWALPGGFLDYGESLEESAMREAKEETNLELEDMKQFHTYSAMGRDPRFQTITTVFTAKGVGQPQAGDDAQNLKVVPMDELPNLEYAFDHKEIIGEYLRTRHEV